MGDRIGVQLPVWEIYLSLTNQPSQLTLAIPVGRCNEYLSKGGDALQLGVKKDMVLFDIDVGQINKVTLRRARVVQGWVTISEFNSQCGKFISV